MTRFAVDTSVAVPLLVRRHPRHADVARWASGHELLLAGHAEVETYAVLTRLPDPFRLDPESVALVLSTGFGPAIRPARAEAVVHRIASSGVAGGAVYDALVAIAAADSDLPLATLDARAVPTYSRLGARVAFVV